MVGALGRVLGRPPSLAARRGPAGHDRTLSSCLCLTFTDEESVADLQMVADARFAVVPVRSFEGWSSKGTGA